MDDAAAFAALAALPERFTFRLQRRTLSDSAGRSPETRIDWEIALTLGGQGLMTLMGYGATLSAAFADARAQLVAYQELL